MKHLFSKKIILILMALSLVLTGCSGMIPKFELNALDKLKDGNIIVVGRITLDPALSKDEIDISGCLGGCYVYNERIYLKITDKYYDATSSDANNKNSHMVNFEGDFYTQYPTSKDMNILGVWFYTQAGHGSVATMFYAINDGIKVTYPSGAKAVYIGDIYIKRNEFFEIEDVKIRQDDYKGANKRFQEKFGTNIKLVQAKLYSAN